MDHDSDFVAYEPCEACGSQDNKAVFSDGHKFCYGCQDYERGDGSKEQRANAVLEKGEYRALVKRGLRGETLRKFDYRLAGDAHFATYYDAKGKAVAQKKRSSSKDFAWIGDPAAAVLFGQQCWASGGKKLVITEGEIDAMSMSQAQNNRWPVVSVRDGAGSAPLSIKKSLEYVCSFDEVIFMLDSDEPGVNAAVLCAELLPPGKAKIAHLPLKDAGEMLEAGRSDELIDAMWRARPYRPDGIVAGEDIWDLLQVDDPVREADYPYCELDHMLHGLRKSEIVTFVAGTGVGKSTICKEVAHSLIMQGKTVGMVALEETVKFTAKSLMSIELNQPLHLMPMKVEDPAYLEAYKATAAKVAFYDHFGSTDSDNLLSKMRYMAVGLGCEYIVLDHISIIVSGSDTQRDNERVQLDRTMTRLASLCREVNIGLLLVCHLRKSGGKPFEEGGQVTLADVRGTAGIGQLSNIVVAAERDQQSGDSKITQLRVLKNRFSGTTGPAGQLDWHDETGRLLDHDPFAEGSETTGTQQAPQLEDPDVAF